jgi:mono/diheme cytochrome c family protein
MDKLQVRDRQSMMAQVCRRDYSRTLRAVMARAVIVAIALSIVLTSERTATADDATAKDTKAESFLTGVAPLLKTHCIRCHGGKDPKGELSLEPLRDAWNVQKDYELGQRILQVLSNKEMPPEGEPQPDEATVKSAIRALEAELALFDCTKEKHPGRVTIRRLNRAEYNNTVQDLVGINFKPADDFPSDDVGHGFDNIGDVLSIPPILLEKYLNAAEAIVDRVFKDPAARNQIVQHERLFGEAYRGDAARKSLSDFATRAFRRPAMRQEVDRLMRLMQLCKERGSADEESFQMAMIAVLSSPHFLFRVERDPAEDDQDKIRELSDYEIASRLSYYLWSTMPDAELFELAKQKKLRNPDVLRQQVQRMLQHPKANALVKNFAGQWLQLRDLPNMTPDPERFPDFDEALRTSMARETELFFEAMVREDRSVLEFLDADFSFINERLARHYGIKDVTGDEFRRMPLGDQRRGVVTHGSILLLTSNPTRTSPVKRGKWILENILGDAPPPPPPGVDELQEEGELLGSLRERMEQHRANEACAVCHRTMDTLGFGLENFDAIGAWRKQDGMATIDPSGALPGGKEFQGPKELMKILVQEKRPEFCRCLTEKMLTYSLGRGLQSNDRCAVDGIMKQLAERGYRFSALVESIVTSDPFLLREAKRE